MRSLLSVVSLFHNECNKFNNTGTRKLDSIYYAALKLRKNHIFGVKNKKKFTIFLATYVFNAIN